VVSGYGVYMRGFLNCSFASTPPPSQFRRDFLAEIAQAGYYERMDEAVVADEQAESFTHGFQLCCLRLLELP